MSEGCPSTAADLTVSASAWSCASSYTASTHDNHEARAPGKLSRAWQEEA